MSGGRLDLAGIVQNIFHLFKGKLNHVCLGPTDGSVLKIHYRWAFYFTLGSFLMVWHGWFFGKVIHCISNFKGDEGARTDYTHICLSYPYINDDSGDKRYLLFYRWVHWYFLVLSFLFYLPRKISKSIENPKAKKVLEDLTTLSPRYDQAEKEITQRAMHYMLYNMRTHNSVYLNYLGLNFGTLIMDIFILRFTDFILQNRFVSLVPLSYPFNRDPDNFQDYISQTFPPFSFCTLGDAQKIMNARTERLGCHLINMELYEKIFIIFWFIIYILITITFLHILYLLFMIFPWARRWFIPTSKPLNATISTRVAVFHVLTNLKVGDIYMLSRLKQQMSPSRFYELLIRLGDPQYLKSTRIDQEMVSSSVSKGNHPESQAMKNRQLNMSSPYNPNYPDQRIQTNNPNMLNKLLSDPNNPELIKRYPEMLKAQNKLNTSILIDN